MEQNKGAVKASRAQERIFILVTATVLVLFFYQLYAIIQPRFAEVAPRLKAGTMVNLNAEKPAEHIRNLLKKGYYFEDQRDIDLIEKTVASAMPNAPELDNIGGLNKSRYFLPADEAYAKGGNHLKLGCWHHGHCSVIRAMIRLNSTRSEFIPSRTPHRLISAWASMISVE